MSSDGQNGKGDKRRPAQVDPKTLDQNWRRAFARGNRTSKTLPVGQDNDPEGFGKDEPC